MKAAASSHLGDQTGAVGSKGLEVLLLGGLSLLLVDILVIGVEGVPHGGHDLGHLTEGCIGVGPFDGSLRVSEEEGVR